MQQQNNINQTIIPLYQYKQKIVISEGFYKGFFGLILSYEQKGNMIYYKVLIKDSDKEEIERSIRSILGGRNYYPSSLVNKFFKQS